VKREWAALIFAMMFPTIMTWFYFVALSRPQTSEPRELVSAPGNFWVQSAYGAGKVVQFSFPLLYLAFMDPKVVRPRRPQFKGLGLGIGFGLWVGIGVFFLYHVGLRSWLIEMDTASRIRSKIEEFNADTPLRYAGLAGFLAVVHSLLEEYYWRWFVFGRLRTLISLPLAIALSSLAFMAHHVIVLSRFFPNEFWTAAVPFSLCIAVGGAFWAWLYNHTGSIYSPWVSHLLVDVAVLGIGYDMVFNG
jgi:membrane protease YdiL (CAAX protease family)